MVSVGERAYRTLRLRAEPIGLDALLRQGRWLFLIPHADDETLGCGGLIYRLAAAGARPLVVYLTDGGASHRGSPTWPPMRLAARRKLEAQWALRLLHVPRADVVWLDWPDANPHSVSSHAWRADAERLSRLCRAKGVHAIASTWEEEPHCDHVAASQLAGELCNPSIVHYAYLVWGWTRRDLPQQLAGQDLRRVDVSGTQALRKRALAMHRTQTLSLIHDADEAFRLPSEMAALTQRSSEILIRLGERRHAV